MRVRSRVSVSVCVCETTLVALKASAAIHAEVFSVTSGSHMGLEQINIDLCRSRPLTPSGG